MINSSNLQGLPGQSGSQSSSGSRPEKEPPTSLPINNQTTAPGVISQCQNQPTTTSEGVDGSSYQSDQSKRPIFPHLPYSPYCSPNSSPRVRRKPLRETTRVNSINDQSGEYIQLNQYKLMGMVGQGSYSIVKMAYNMDEDTHYVRFIVFNKGINKGGCIHIVIFLNSASTI